MACYEMMEFKEPYQRQVLRNAKAFARALKGEGLPVEGDPALGHTETHQVILRTDYARGARVAAELERNHIILNYQAVPDDEGFTSSSGLRLGVQEMTRFGMREADFEELAGYLADVILRGRGVAEEVSALRQRFSEMGYCLWEEEARPLAEALLEAMGPWTF
jgi:glycine/serine hydroxymethyltransferase